MHCRLAQIYSELKTSSFNILSTGSSLGETREEIYRNKPGSSSVRTPCRFLEGVPHPCDLSVLTPSPRQAEPCSCCGYWRTVTVIPAVVIVFQRHVRQFTIIYHSQGILSGTECGIQDDLNGRELGETFTSFVLDDSPLPM